MRVPRKQPYRLACSMQPVLVLLWLCWCLIVTAARVARIRRAISSLMLRHACGVCWAARSPMSCDTALPCTGETQPCGSEPRTA
ncbi:hypothetical protein F5883DRAFT_534777 [Diaporthe sp. PMI_573]|nr:hypothetical protein F5883DRAFT_534777 [Diaporthaceae sp. PMI_573]